MNQKPRTQTSMANAYKRRTLTVDQIAQAACGNADPGLFAERTLNETGAAYRYRAALTICESCPIKRDCYEVAASWGDAFGIFGGVMFADGRTAWQPASSAQRAKEATAKREQRRRMTLAERRDELVYSLIRTGLTHAQVAEQVGLAVRTIERSLARTLKRQTAAELEEAAA